jgi:hypothetical protein
VEVPVHVRCDQVNVAGAIVALFDGPRLEEVEPGAYRVLSDGVRDLSEQVQDVAVSAEGDVWLELGSLRNWSVVRLGASRASETLGGRGPWRLPHVTCVENST